MHASSHLLASATLRYKDWNQLSKVSLSRESWTSPRQEGGPPSEHKRNLSSFKNKEATTKNQIKKKKKKEFYTSVKVLYVFFHAPINQTKFR